MRDHTELEREIAALLADAAHSTDPLYQALEKLQLAYLEQKSQIRRLAWISDRYQAVVLDENRLLGVRAEQQKRRLQKIARISDRYQEMQLELARDLRTSATHDALTGLPNRRLMLEQLRSAERNHGATFSLAILDVDHFKEINDLHGHHVGDQVLIQIATLLRGQLRTNDLCARWGGEEFLLLWPGISPDTAAEIAERIRLAAADTVFDVQGQSLRLTTSIGVAGHLSKTGSVETIKRADLALYEAKHSGRNRIVVAGSEPVPGAAVSDLRLPPSDAE